MLWGLTHYFFFSLCLDKLFSLREKVLDPGLKYCPVLMGCNVKVIKTVLGRKFLSISWLKWFIVAYSTIALYVFFYKKQMCPCLPLFLFVWFSITEKWYHYLGRSPLCSFRAGREGKVRPWRWGWGTVRVGSSKGGQRDGSTWARGELCNGRERVGGKANLQEANAQSRKKTLSLELSACQ